MESAIPDSGPAASPGQSGPRQPGNGGEDRAVEQAGTRAPRADAWNPLTRLLFRFFCTYFVLYNLDFPFSLLPVVGNRITNAIASAQKAMVSWTGRQLLHFPEPVTYRVTGSGDTTWNYVQLFDLIVIATVITLVWSVLDRRRSGYTKLHRWLRVLLRFSLGMTMCSYGAFKVIKTQFPLPPYERLLEPYGASTPMALLWTFMGYSGPYNVFTGLGEMVGGFLLFFRRLTTAGTLLIIAVLSNVVMLNFSYDVPVKLYSVNLLVMAFFLLAPDIRRLIDAFILNRPVPPRALTPLFARTWMNRVAMVSGMLVAGFAVYSTLHQSSTAYASRNRTVRSPVHGMWEVEEFARNNQVLPPLVTDTTRWRRLLISSMNRMSLVLMSDSLRSYRMRLDTAVNTFAVMPYGQDTTALASFAYSLPDGDHMRIEGVMGSDSVRVSLRRRADESLMLVSRGFHWVNETPFNR